MKKHTAKELMSPNLIFIEEETTLSEAARIMKKENCGMLVIRKGGKPEGIITDRDLVTRALINGEHHAQSVKDFMTTNVCCCYENDALTKVVEIMRQNGVNRLVVKDEAGEYTGLLAFGDIMLHDAKGWDINNICPETA